MNIKVIKIISSVLTVAGVVVNLAANAVGERLLDNKIATKIQEALTDK